MNLIAERRVVPELIQKDFTPAKVAQEVLRLLNDPRAREDLRAGLARRPQAPRAAGCGRASRRRNCRFSRLPLATLRRVSAILYR